MLICENHNSLCCDQISKLSIQSLKTTAGIRKTLFPEMVSRVFILCLKVL